MQQTSRVDFIEVFTHSFYALQSQNHKKLLDLAVFFAILGSAHVKAARSMLVKLTPRSEVVIRASSGKKKK